MIRVYKNGQLTNEFEDSKEGRVAAARIVGKDAGGLRFRGGVYKSGEWEVQRDLGVTRVYKYGLLPPTQNADLVDAEISGAHAYYNMLIEIERRRRQAYADLMSQFPEVAELEACRDALSAQIDAACQVVKDQRKSTRSRSELPAERETIKELKARRKQVSAQLKTAKKQLREQVADDLKAIQEAAQAEIRRLRKTERRCTWGTGGLIEDAVNRAARTSKAPPEFKAWRRTKKHSLGVQIVGGSAVQEVVGAEHTQIQIDPVDLQYGENSEGRPKWVKPAPRSAQRTKVRLRVGSKGRSPVWAEWPMMYHRPLPEGCTVMQAVITRRQQDCRRFKWELCVIVREAPQIQTKQSGFVSVLTGTYRHNGRLVVAGWTGSDGRTGTICLNEGFEETADRVEKLQSLRDQLLDSVRDALVERLASIEFERPDWLTAETIHIAKWRSPARFAALARYWKERRFDGDELVYRDLEAWRYRDEHLERMQSGLRRKAEARRREAYRLAAVDLARCYGQVTITAPKVNRKKPDESSARPKMSGLRRAENRAARAELQLIIKEAFEARGGEVCERAIDDAADSEHILPPLAKQPAVVQNN